MSSADQPTQPTRKPQKPQPPQPSVAVCIPTFGDAPFLARALDSVAAQTYRHVQVVVVEDGSSGPSESVARASSLAANFSLCYAKADRNRGSAATRNVAASLSDATLLAFLDSDDEWTSDHLEQAVRVLGGSTAALCYSGISEVDEHGRELFRRVPTQAELADLPQALFHRCFVIPSSVVVRASIFRDVGGFREDQRHCEDLDLWMRLLRAGEQLAFSGVNSCRYRQHDGAKTGLATNMRLFRALVYSRFWDWQAVPLRVRQLRRAKAWWQTAVAAGVRSPSLLALSLEESVRGILGLPPSRRLDVSPSPPERFDTAPKPESAAGDRNQPWRT